MSKYVDVNVELLKKVVKKSGLTQEQFNEDMRLPKCKRMVHNCIARGKLRKDQAYVIIQKYGLDEKEFIIDSDNNIPDVFIWISSLSRDELIAYFGYESLDDLLESRTTLLDISASYYQSANKDRHDEFCNKFTALMDEYGLSFDEAVKVAAQGRIKKSMEDIE